MQRSGKLSPTRVADGRCWWGVLQKEHFGNVVQAPCSHPQLTRFLTWKINRTEMKRTSKEGTLFHAYLTKYAEIVTKETSVFKIRGVR